MIHAIVETPHGYLLVTTDERGVLVLTRPVPPALRHDLEALRNFVKEGGVYLVAFSESPGQIHALRVPGDWTGGAFSRQAVITRAEAVAEAGEALVDVCCTAATMFAERAFESWRDDGDQRRAALRAVIRNATPGEA